MDDSSVTGDTIRRHLEAALPVLVSRQLREIGVDHSN